MSQPTAQRPPQVTMAAGVVMFASVMVLLTAVERLSGLRSLETRNGIEDLLAEPVVGRLGIDFDGAMQVLYVSGVIAALCAAATAILGWFVLKPDTSARRFISILAVPLFLTGLTAGGFAASFVAAGAAMLWMQPAREWFATGKWTPPTPPPAAEASRRTPWSSPGTSADAPGPSTHAFQAPPPQGSPANPTAHPTAHPTAYAAHDRPRAVIAAFVLTVVTAGAVLVLSLMSLAVMGLSPDVIMTELERQQPELVADGLTMDELRFSTYVSAAVAILWCSVALVFAGFAMARRAWARLGLMISAAFSAGACFLVALSAPFLIIPAIAAMMTVACLRRVEVRHWFATVPG